MIGVPKGTVAASVGVAHFPSDAVNRDDLVETADNALYFAKYLGRNRVERGSSAVANFERDPRKLHELLVHANQSTVEALAAAIDARDQYTAGHSRRVAEYALELATFSNNLSVLLRRSGDTAGAEARNEDALRLLEQLARPAPSLGIDVR